MREIKLQKGLFIEEILRIFLEYALEYSLNILLDRIFPEYALEYSLNILLDKHYPFWINTILFWISTILFWINVILFRIIIKNRAFLKRLYEDNVIEKG